jgi:acyl-CoA thioesterase FadM
VSVGCDFAKPARFEDVLSITVTVEKVGTKSVSYRFDVARGAEPIATGRITAVYCRAAGHGQIEALDIPADLRTKLES